MTNSINYITTGRPPASTIVWKPKLHSINHFDFDKFKERVAELKAEGNKKGLKILEKNVRKVCKDNPNMFDDFLTELLRDS
tara:strand:- start:361 stop:603 length:243 start_codon:yes stop_codon:yes gene_type:complete